MSAIFLEVLDDFLRAHGARNFRAKEVAPVGRPATKEEGAPHLMPPPAELWGLIVPTIHVAEWLRVRVGNIPVHVTSGWRDAKYNRAVDGRPRSRHLVFNALDLWVAGFTGAQLAELLEAHPLQAYLGIGTYRSLPAIVHVDTRGLFGGSRERWEH